MVETEEDVVIAVVAASVVTEGVVAEDWDVVVVVVVKTLVVGEPFDVVVVV